MTEEKIKEITVKFKQQLHDNIENMQAKNDNLKFFKKLAVKDPVALKLIKGTKKLTLKEKLQITPKGAVLDSI